MTNIDNDWQKFLLNETDINSKPEKSIIENFSPKCSPIYISTKTKINVEKQHVFGFDVFIVWSSFWNGFW